MTLPKSLDAYNDCEAHFERAKASPRGIAITVGLEGDARQLCLRMNGYRDKLRRQSKKVYPEGDPRYGVSAYDALQITIDRDNPKRVLIRPYLTEIVGVENL